MHQLIRQQRSTCQAGTGRLVTDGNTVTTPEDICAGFAKHYSQLALPVDKPHFDNSYRDEVTYDSVLIHDLCKTEKKPIPPVTIDEVSAVIQQLKNKKAPDVHGLTAEHLKHAGNLALNSLTIIFNNIFATCRIPPYLKQGILTPVYKKKKDRTDPRNYRGITVTPILGKVLELLLRKLIRPILQTSQASLQRGFTPDCSPIHAALILQEIYAESKLTKKNLLISFLDAKTAFDVVNQDSLLRKLYMEGVTGDLWLLVSNLQESATTAVKWAGETSTPFPVRQGVRQGGILSTDFYKVYNNNLIKRLESSAYGTTIGDIPCCAPTCADDIALASDTESNLQHLIDVATTYSNRERYELQPTKSLILPCCHTSDLATISDKHTWYINEDPMPVVDKAEHLGFLRDRRNFGQKATVENNIHKARKSLYALMGAGLHGKNGLRPDAAYHIYQVYVLPVLLYGLEILLPEGQLLHELEIFHKKTMKHLLTLPTNVADPVPFILLGAQPINSFIHQKALVLLGNILRSTSSVEHRLAERQILRKDNKYSWFSKISDLLTIYNLPTMETLLVTKPPKSRWNAIVRKATSAACRIALTTQAKMYSSLSYLNVAIYSAGANHPCWKTIPANRTAARKAIVKIKLLTGTYPLRSNRQAFNQYGVDKTCPLCLSAPETREHFLLLCPSLKTTRRPFLSQLKGALGYRSQVIDQLTCILDPSVLLPDELSSETYAKIETIARDLCYQLHLCRQKLLTAEMSTSTQ